MKKNKNLCLGVRIFFLLFVGLVGLGSLTLGIRSSQEEVSVVEVVEVYVTFEEKPIYQVNVKNPRTQAVRLLKVNESLGYQLSVGDRLALSYQTLTSPFCQSYYELKRIRKLS